MENLEVLNLQELDAKQVNETEGGYIDHDGMWMSESMFALYVWVMNH